MAADVNGSNEFPAEETEEMNIALYFVKDSEYSSSNDNTGEIPWKS